MSKRYKKCVVFFTASKEIEIPLDADPHKELLEKIALEFADGTSNLRYEGDFRLLTTKEECKTCGDFVALDEIKKSGVCENCVSEMDNPPKIGHEFKESIYAD